MTPRDRDRWQAAVLRDSEGLTPGDKCVGLAIALHLNFDTDRCFPSVALLAEEVGATVRGVAKSIANLEARGWISRTSTGGGRTSNRYTLLFDRVPAVVPKRQNEPSTSEYPNTGVSQSTPEPRFRGDMNRGSGVPGTVVHPNNEENTEGNNETSSAAQARLLRTKIAQLFRELSERDASGKPHIPSCGRADIWLAKGYGADLIVAVIRSGLERKPGVRSLKYFDEPLAEAHGNARPRGRKDEPPPTAAEIDAGYRAALRRFRENPATWPRAFGPRPDEKGCKLPARLLAEFGYASSQAA